MKKIVYFDKCGIKMCRHPSHSPPTMIVLKPGIYIHECPGCHKKQTVEIPIGPSW